MEGNNIDYSVQSIRDSLIQAGCINEKIKAVFKVNKFLLAENYTGNVYKYEAINCLTHEKKYLFFTKKPVAESKHAEIAERIIKMFVLDKEPTNRADGSVSQINGFAKEKDVRKAGKQTFVAIKDNSEIDFQLSENIIEPHEPVATISAKPDADENFILIINKIFKEELPEYGYAIRKSQIELAEMIFRTLQTGNISLCEAEVGIGKTHAYIIAAIIHRLNNKNFNRIRTSYPLSNDFYMSSKMPVVISTSSIALQKAVAYDYIPEISKILMSCGLIDKPLSCVIRKGKEHYICDKRLNDYTASLSAKNNKNEKDIAVEKLLNQLRSAGFLTIDLDDYDNLSCYVKSRICVSSQCNSKCDMFSTCRYNRYLKHAKSYNHDFQICNHNYLLADVRHRSKGLSPLIPNYQAVIIDEAHKLIGAARQMYGNSITSHEIPRLMSYILKMKYRQERTTKLIDSYCNRLTTLNNNLFDELKKPVLDYDTEDDTERYKTVITPTAQKTIKSVIYTLESLIGMLEDSSCLKDRPKSIYKYILRSLRELVDRFNVYLDCRNIVYWIEIPGGDIKSTGKAVLCSIPKGLENLLYEDIWSKSIPIVLTSGTLSVNGCFSHIKKNIGIDRVRPDRLDETSKKSPFNYSENSLLYISDKTPFPDSKDPKYIKAVSDEVERLIKATYGHTLVLFTSYKVMELVYNQVSCRIKQFPVYKMGKGSINPIDAFKQSKNGVLFASGNCWEGIDVPGDTLSSLIIVKLPFAVPDPISEYEQTLYDSADEYKNKVVFPEMIIKLKQGVGRLIRNEADTGVISILDSRLKVGGNYRDRVIKALPDCRLAGSVLDVEKFIREKKCDLYFSGQ